MRRLPGGFLVRLDDLDYDLPPSAIAQVPAARREEARLLVLDRGSADLADLDIARLPDLLRPGDLLVLNDTRVLPARLITRRDTGGRVEVFLLEPLSDGDWEALVRSGGSPREGERLAVGADGGLWLVEALGAGHWRVRGDGVPLEDLMARDGRMPLPPYIHREDEDPRAALDRERYQTTFARAGDARARGAIAAPTAGLHVTPALLDRIEKGGVAVRFLTLHVGLGTFEPVRSERLEDHVMHEEIYDIPVETADAVRGVREAGGRVVAVGTTCVRTLEAAALSTPDGLPVPGPGRTRLLIQPGFEFRVVDALLTNFHLPRSTLLALVSALAGTARILDAYREAVSRGYRFYSYGDAMFIA